MNISTHSCVTVISDLYATAHVHICSIYRIYCPGGSVIIIYSYYNINSDNPHNGIKYISNGYINGNNQY